MISFQTILSQIEKHMHNAKNAGNEQQMREQIIAIRALCDAVLAEQNVDKTTTIHSVKERINVQPLDNPITMSSNKLQEDDANGNSIFDF